MIDLLHFTPPIIRMSETIILSDFIIILIIIVYWRLTTTRIFQFFTYYFSPNIIGGSFTLQLMTIPNNVISFINCDFLHLFEFFLTTYYNSIDVKNIFLKYESFVILLQLWSLNYTCDSHDNT